MKESDLLLLLYERFCLTRNAKDAAVLVVEVNRKVDPCYEDVEVPL